MSDISQGAGWWLASDGKWYPPRNRNSTISVQAKVLFLRIVIPEGVGGSRTQPQWLRQRSLDLPLRCLTEHMFSTRLRLTELHGCLGRHEWVVEPGCPMTRRSVTALW